MPKKEIPKNINIELPDPIRKALEIVIEAGLSRNASEFVYNAIISQLKDLGIINQQIEIIMKTLKEEEIKVP